MLGAARRDDLSGGHHGCNAGSRFLQAGYNRGSACLITDHHCLLAGLDTVRVDEAQYRTAQHDAGQIVVLEDERRFVGAGCDDDLRGPQLHEPLPYMGLPDTILLDNAEQVALVQAQAGRRREHLHARQCRQPGSQLLHRLGNCVSIRAAAGVAEVPSQLRLIVNERHAATLLRGGDGGCDSGRAATDDHYVGMDVEVLVAQRVVRGRRGVVGHLTKSGYAAD